MNKRQKKKLDKKVKKFIECAEAWGKLLGSIKVPDFGCVIKAQRELMKKDGL